MLDPVELISRFTTGRLRKRTQIVECAASEFNGFRIDHWIQIYKILYDLATGNRLQGVGYA